MPAEHALLACVLCAVFRCAFDTLCNALQHCQRFDRLGLNRTVFGGRGQKGPSTSLSGGGRPFPFRDASVSLGSPLSEGSPVRASDACCHLRLMPLTACAPGAPASACSAGGQLLGQPPSAILSLSWMSLRCLGRPLGQAVISAGSVITLAALVPTAGGASGCSWA